MMHANSPSLVAGSLVRSLFRLLSLSLTHLLALSRSLSLSLSRSPALSLSCSLAPVLARPLSIETGAPSHASCAVSMLSRHDMARPLLEWISSPPLVAAVLIVPKGAESPSAKD